MISEGRTPSKSGNTRAEKEAEKKIETEMATGEEENRAAGLEKEASDEQNKRTAAAEPDSEASDEEEDDREQNKRTAAAEPDSEASDEEDDREQNKRTAAAEPDSEASDEEEDDPFLDLDSDEIEKVYRHVKLGTHLKKTVGIFTFLIGDFKRKKGRGQLHCLKYLRYEKFCYIKGLLRGHSLFWFEQLFRVTREELHRLMMREMPPRALQTLEVEWIYKIESGQLNEREREEWGFSGADIMTEEDEDILDRFAQIFERWAREARETLPETSPAAPFLAECGKFDFGLA